MLGGRVPARGILDGRFLDRRILDRRFFDDPRQDRSPKETTVIPRKPARFRFRSLVSVSLVLCALALAVTGAILFIVPPGRVANWTGWTLLGLTKDRWQSLHIGFAILFVLGAGLHAYFNVKPLLSYFRDRERRTFALRREWVAALCLSALVAIGTLAGLPPFSSLIAFQEEIKRGYDRREEPAPIPHAEQMTLRELAETTGADLETLERNLRARKIALEPEDATLDELAARHGMTPHALYRIAVGDGAGGALRGAGRGAGGGGGAGGRAGGGAAGGGAGRGRGRTTGLEAGAEKGVEGDGQGRAEALGDGIGGGRGGGAGPSRGGGGGRLTLEGWCALEGVDVAAAVERLGRAGVPASAAMSIREISNGAGMHPREIQEIARAEDAGEETPPEAE